MTTFPRTAAFPAASTAAFTRTRAAARYALQHASSHITAARAQLLLDQLARCETILAAGGGRPTPDSYGLLRAVVLTVRDLTGTGWLEATAGDPAVDAFTALYAAPAPPRPPDMDDTLAGVIWTRFAPRGASGPEEKEQNRLPNRR